MSHLHRGRFIRLRAERNKGRDGAAVLDHGVKPLPAAPHVAIGAVAAAAATRAKAKAKRKTARRR